MEKILLVDTETCNGIETENGLDLTNSLIYDIGFMVCDLDSNVYEKHSYTIADIFLDNELMSTAYFKDFIPQYWEDIKNGTRKLRRLSTVRHIICDIVKQYDIKKIYAYNIKFDYDAFLTTQRYLTSSKYRYFLPYSVNKGVNDIMKLGRELTKEQDYKDFCKANNYLTKNGRPQIKAETVARYLFDNTFIEEHKGLEDCEIEYKILIELSKKYPQIDTRLWG